MSSGLFTEVPKSLPMLLIAIVTIPCGLAVASMLKSDNDKVACDIAAAEWEMGNANGGAYRPSEAPYFAKQYKVFRTACPNGHIEVNEANIPAAVKAGYAPAKK